MHDETPDLFHVRLANGELRVLTLEQLDDAFQARWIDERTPVLRAGELAWSTLGQIAGLDETPAPVAVAPSSVAPVALDGALEADELPPELRPRRRARLFGVALAIALVGGVSFTAARAGPGIAAPLRAQIARLRAPKSGLGAAEGPKAAAAMAPASPASPATASPVAAPPAPAAPPPAAQPAARAAPEAHPAVPTIAASALPNAKATPARRPRR